MPTYDVKPEDIKDGGVDILTVLVNSGLCSSRGDARRNVEQGGVTVGDEKITDSKYIFMLGSLKGDGIIVKRGKKNFVKVKTE